MTASQQYGRFAQLLQDGSQANLFLGASDAGGDGIELQQVDIADVADHFLEVARSVVASRDTTLPAMQFQPGEKPGDGRLVYLEPHEVPGVDERVAQVQNSANLPWFEGDADFKRRLKFYVLRVQRGQETAYFFRQMNPKAEVYKKGILVRLAGHRFNAVREQLFLFDEHFDFVVFGGYAFLFTYQPFTNLFKEEMRVAFAERAAPAFQVVRETVRMSNVDAFIEACQGDHRLSAALVRVMERGGLTNLTTDWILQKNALLTAHRLTVAPGPDGLDYIEFEPAPAKRFILTKILEEKVNLGDLTGTTWVAGSHTAG